MSDEGTYGQYTCELCSGTFDKVQSDEASDCEAEMLFGIQSAHIRGDMAIVCDDCFALMAKRYGWKVTSDTTHGMLL